MKEVLVFFFCIGMAGCVNMPRVGPADTTTAAELSSHIHFLAQPSLKGRKPGTRGSRLARNYIETRFAAYGLVPWGAEKDYTLSFGYGKNVVGILPGTDKTLASEIVLLSAHYDHLGKKKGKVYPGASDNASGVAALLATARQMSQHRPKRTVAFAAFDCEERMLLGSFAFSSRPDVTNANIVGVINIDMLGRDFLDAVRETLFVSGTEHYPALRKEVFQFGTKAQIRVLPLGSDLVGPRSDHVAFASLGIPCLFFSCGTGMDYHAPSDTAETLDYSAIERSAKVIFNTVAELANTNEKLVAKEDDSDAEELRTVQTVLSEVIADSKQPAAKAKNLHDVRKEFRKVEIQLKTTEFRGLADEVEALLLKGRYDREAREKLVIDATGILAPYLLPASDHPKNSAQEQSDQKFAMQFLEWLYLRYGDQIMEGYRQFVVQLLKYQPGVFHAMPKFEREIYEIADGDIRLTPTAQGTWILNALSSQFIFKAETKSSIWPLKTFGSDLSVGADGIDCEGTREQIADFCLLRLRAAKTNELHSEKLKKVLAVVSGTQIHGDYRALLRERLRVGGFADETAWLANCLVSGSPELALGAIEAVRRIEDGAIRTALKRIIVDRKVRSDVRAAAIKCVGHAEPEILRKVLEDQTPVYKLDYIARFRPGYPFAERIPVKLLGRMMNKRMQHSAEVSKTIGDLAREQLEKKTAKREVKKA